MTPPTLRSQESPFTDEIGQELALGRELAAAIERQATLVDDPVIANYLEALGERIVQASDAPGTLGEDFDFSFRVVDDPNPNEYSIPGGFIYINLGTLLAVESQAELAAVLAHQVAHVVESRQRVFAGQALGGVFGSIPLMFVHGAVSERWDERIAIPSVLLDSSRRDEIEADARTIRYMTDAGYDPAR